MRNFSPVAPKIPRCKERVSYEDAYLLSCLGTGKAKTPEEARAMFCALKHDTETVESYLNRINPVKGGNCD